MAAEFYNITKDEMAQRLEPQGFKLYDRGFLKTPNGQAVMEMVWAKKIVSNKNIVVLRIYTGIDWRTGESRNVGKDAIRVQAYYQHDGKVVRIGGSKRVNRVENWAYNLQARITLWQEAVGPTCKCGKPMVLRKPKKGQKWSPFYSCVGWKPHGQGCNGTCKADDWQKTCERRHKAMMDRAIEDMHDAAIEQLEYENSRDVVLY